MLSAFEWKKIPSTRSPAALYLPLLVPTFPARPAVPRFRVVGGEAGVSGVTTDFADFDEGFRFDFLLGILRPLVQ